MKIIEQETWAQPDSYASLDSESMVIHRHQSGRDRLVVFVHGLGGRRYGKRPTWGNFPAWIFEEDFNGNGLAEFDVGLYGYQTLSSRLMFLKSIELESEAEILADIMRDQTDYKYVVLIGHSMGGLLCKAAIAHLIKTGQTKVLDKIVGLGLMATPQLGSQLVPGFLTKFSPDFRALKPHGRFVSTVTDCFQDHLSLQMESQSEIKAIVPTWVVKGAADFWVDQLSAGINIGSNCKKAVKATHTAIVKPEHKDSDAYTWTLNRIVKSFDWALSSDTKKSQDLVFENDMFIAAPMAGFGDQDQFAKDRLEILKLKEGLRQKCGFEKIFYAGENISQNRFDPADLSVKQDLEELRKSKYFLLLYPEKIVSSVIFEAGIALTLEKTAFFFAKSRSDLPFLMRRANQAFPNVKIYEYDSIEDVVDTVLAYQTSLSS